MITSIAELRAYLDKIAGRIDDAEQHPRGANHETFCAQMWKDFTPHALSLWTPPGVLEHVAACMAPADVEDEDEDDG